MVRRLKAKRVDLDKYIRNQHLLWTLVVLAILLVTALMARTGFSQEKPKYDSVPFPPEFTVPTGPSASRAEVRKIKSEIRDNESIARDWCDGDRAISPRADVERFMNLYVLAAMTHYDQDNLGLLGERREDLFKTYVSRCTPEARNILINDIIWPFCKSVSTGNYHPACRMNAVYIMGRLNDVEGTSNTTPTPSTRAFAELMTIINDANSPSYLQVAAMVGLKRHAEIAGIRSQGQANPAMSGLTDRMIAILKEPSDSNAPEKQWMKRRAVQILGALRWRGDANGVENALRQAIADKQLDIWTRYDAVEAFRDLNYGNATDMRPVDSAKEIAQFAADYLKFEADHIANVITEYVEVNKLYEEGGVGKADSETAKGRNRGGDTAKGVGQSSSAAGSGIGSDDGIGGGANADDGDFIDIEIPEYDLNAVRERMMVVLDLAQLSIQGKESSRGIRVFGMAQRTPAGEPENKEKLVEWGSEIEKIKMALSGEDDSTDDDAAFNLAARGQQQQTQTAKLRMKILKAAKDIELMIDDKKKDATEVFK